MKNLLIALLVICSFATFAGDDEHALSRIQGTSIDLKTFDHAFGGSIGNAAVWGFLDELTFTSDLKIRKYGQTVTAIFKRGENGVSGTITRNGVDGALVNTTIQFMGLVSEENIMNIRINGQDLVVKITADKYENGHFINPKYTTVISGEEVSFTLYGEACYGLSIHFAMMIFGSYMY